MAFASNGCEKFECKPAEGLVKPFRTHPQNVAAIDFGTANCSLMYLLSVNKMKDPSKVEPVRLKLDGHFRVPNCALFDRRGNMMAFGLYAQRLYYKSVKRQDLKQVFFFQRIKMQLQHDDTVSRKTIVKAVNGAEFYLVDVIAHILNWLKEKLLEQEARLKKKATDFDWVITVPAIWKARGKQMMREAGYKAGLCTVRKPQPLRQACDIEPQMIEEAHPDRLTLALEPECATAHCRQAGGFRGEENYLLVDIGGGTVDIVSHAIVAGHLEEIIPPQGNAWGGTTINDSFRDFLGRTLGDPSFFRYVGPHVEEEIRTSNSRDLDFIVNKEFEEIKRDFGAHYNEEQGTEGFAIQLPPSFWENYKGNMKTKGKEGVSFDMHTHELTLSRKKMVELFEPTIRGIISIVKKVLQEVGETIENVYLAGGFGGCHYMTVKLQSVFTEMLQDFELHPAPGEAELGIVHGAVMFRCDPSIIHKRKADATYGVNVSIGFKPDIHDETKKVWNEDQQKYKCNGIFCTIVERGDSISSGSVYVTDVGTSKKDTRIVSMNVYSSSQTDVWYTTDPGVHCIGHFEINVSGYGLHRKIEVAVDFTHAEIQLRAYDKQNPDNEVKLALDFLNDS